MNTAVYTTACQLTQHIWSKSLHRLTKTKSSLKSASDLRKCGQTGPPSEAQTPKDRCHTSNNSGTGMVAPIPRKADNPPRNTGMPCAFCDKYGKRLTHTPQLIARGGPMPVMTTLNGEGVQPCLRNSSPMLAEMSSKSWWLNRLSLMPLLKR